VISEIKKIQAKLDHFDKTVLEDLFWSATLTRNLD
jgi:hypothetical protein